MNLFIAPTAAMWLPKPDEKLGIYGRNLLTLVTGNVKLNNPPPSLAAFAANLTTYEDAIAAAPHTGKAGKIARAAARKPVVDYIKLVRSYAQSVANTQTCAEDAAAVILSAGLQIQKVGKRFKPDLGAKNSAIPGAVLLAALAMKRRGVWFFEFSLDQKTWTSLPESLKASAKVTGLTAMQTYYFRYRLRTTHGLGDYSQVVSLLVL